MKADWLSFDAALRAVLEGVSVLSSEEQPLHLSHRRVLAEPLVSPIDLPRWTNSAMDGFAVLGADVAGATPDAPVELRIVEDIPAGSFPARVVGRGECARIMTGAPVPEGADSVIRVEHTDAVRGTSSAAGTVRIFDAQDVGRNLRLRGEEVRAGDMAIEAGVQMSPSVVGLAASLGYSRVRVIRRPVVALLTSGEELVELDRFDEVLAGRKIVSSNSYTLAAQLAEVGCDVRYLGIAADSRESLAAALSGARGCDAVLTSAGISVGEHDYVRSVLDELQTDVRFWRVRMRPGSPFAFGRIGGLGDLPWFGLPGNPVSSAVTFELFVRPALLKMSGYREVVRRRVRVRLSEPVMPVAGLTQFMRVRLEQNEEGDWTATTTGSQSSGQLSSVARANGLLVVPAGEAEHPAGSLLTAVPLENAWLERPIADSR